MNKPIKRIKLGAKALILTAAATIALSTASCSKEEEGEEIIQYNDKVIISTNNSSYRFIGGVGDTFETVENRSETSAIQFSIKDSDIASVDETGKITMLKLGRTEVYGIMNNDTVFKKDISVHPKATLKIGDKEFKQACSCWTYGFYEDRLEGNYWTVLNIELTENNEGKPGIGSKLQSPDGLWESSVLYPGENFSCLDTEYPTEDFVYNITDNGDETFHITLEGTLESKESFKFEYNGPINSIY